MAEEGNKYGLNGDHERRRQVVVVDRPTEVGVKINNILTALVLMVMSWVGYNIDSMKNQINDISLAVRLQQSEFEHLEERLNDHLKYHREKEAR